ncbi:hypothetical protein AAHA92_26435 [Salvia divinorum]|uniref:Uncharacterized protein n=1 Tax=Salvia divinorum TaxID=28513 RepID=A0ABD1GDX4_SALDI
MEPSNNGASSSFHPAFDFSSNREETKTSHFIRLSSGKRVDPRLLGMLEMFGEIYVERREFFDRIFKGDHEEVFKKIGRALKMKRSKSGSMKRSMSMKSTRQREISVEEINGVNEFRAERFRIRTPIVIVEGGEQGDQAQASGESKT